MIVTGVVFPPAEFTRKISDPLPKRIVFSGPQVPPRKSVAVSATTCTGPPAAGIFFSFPEAKKPIQRLSGDQNGSCASSVPANSLAPTCSMDRTHSMGLVPGTAALNTRACPSGDRANSGMLTVVLRAGEKAVFSGGKTGKLIRSADGELTGGRTAKKTAAPRNSAAAIHPGHH